MSETQYEEPVYVVNQRREGGLAMVHMPDCRTIRHQVEQDIRDEYPGGITSQSEPTARATRFTNVRSCSTSKGSKQCT